VLYGTINVRTGHRIVMRGADMGQGCFHALLREVRRRYKARPVWMLLDEAMCHVAAKSEALAVELDIHFEWLPKHCPELNIVDQIFRHMKAEDSANYQFTSIYEHADRAEHWLLSLTNRETLRKAGVLSKNFWLKFFVQ
jgi:transposase